MTKYLQIYRNAVSTLERETRANIDRLVSDFEAYFDIDGKMNERVALYRTCNVCTGDEKIPFLGPNPYTYVECATCGFRYMDPIIDPQKTTILRDGISKLRETDIKNPKLEKRHQKMTQQVREIIAHHKGGNFLDIGCGLGRHMQLATPYFDSLEGIELDKISRKYCQGIGLKVYGESLERLNLPSNKYDVILLNQVLEHLVDPKNLCLEVLRILRPGGIFYIDTPNFESLSLRLFKENCSVVQGSSHISLFTVKTVRSLLEPLGFETISARTYQTDLFPLDIFAFKFFNNKFHHRRNLFIPLYLAFYRVFHEIFEEKVFRNLGTSMGSYMRIVVKKKLE